MVLVRVAGLAALLSLLAGCATVTGSHTRTGPEYPPKDEDCPVRVYLRGQPLPERYVVVGLVEASGTESIGSLIPELVRQACALGADSIVELQTSTGTGSTTIGSISRTGGQVMGSSYSVFSATATAIVAEDGIGPPPPPRTPPPPEPPAPTPAPGPPAGAAPSPAQPVPPPAAPAPAAP